MCVDAKERRGAKVQRGISFRKNLTDERAGAAWSKSLHGEALPWCLKHLGTIEAGDLAKFEKEWIQGSRPFSQRFPNPDPLVYAGCTALSTCDIDNACSCEVAPQCPSLQTFNTSRKDQQV